MKEREEVEVWSFRYMEGWVGEVGEEDFEVTRSGLCEEPRFGVMMVAIMIDVQS
jgi:hypothetical protein